MRLPYVVVGGLIALAISPCAVAVVDGFFDPAWVGAGRTTFAGDFHNPGYDSGVSQVIVEANGNLLLAGSVIASQQGAYWWLGELRPGGTPVLTFGESNGSGVVTGCYLSTALCSGMQYMSATNLAADGRVAVVAGTMLSRTLSGAHALDGAGVAGGSGIADLGLLRLNNVQGQMVGANVMAALPNGKWIVAGAGKYSAAAANIDVAVVRLKPDFSLDTGFNVVTDSNGVTFAGGKIVNLGAPSSAVAVSVQGDGRIVLVAQVMGSSFSGAVVRLSATGSIDGTFGNGGIASTGNCFPLSGMALDGANRSMLVCQNNGSSALRMARLSGAGTMDSGFGAAGIATAVPDANQCKSSTATAFTIDSAGRILIAGQCSPPPLGAGSPPPARFVVARLHGDDGSLDTSFGIAGFSYGRFAEPSGDAVPWSIVLDAGGQPIVAGDSYSGPSGHSQAGVARLAYDLIYTNGFEQVPRGRL